MNFIVADRAADGLNQSGIDGDTLIDTQAFFIKLFEDFAVILTMAFLDSFFSPR